MKLLKTGLIGLASFVLVVGSTPALAFWTPSNAGQVPPRQVRLAVTPKVDSDVTSLYGAFSKVAITHFNPVQESVADCFEQVSPGCDLSKIPKNFHEPYFVEALEYYPICNEIYKESCIESFELQRPNGEQSQTQFERYAHPQFSIKPGAFPGLPGGESLSIFSNSSTLNGLKSDYVVQALSRYTYDSKMKEFSPNSLNVVVAPISFRASLVSDAPLVVPSKLASEIGPFRNASIVKASRPSGGFFYGPQGAAMQEDFERGAQVRLTLRIPSSLSGWFSGQFSNVKASISHLSERSDRLDLTAEVAVVPVLQQIVPNELVKSGARIGEIDLAQEIVKYPNGRQYIFPANSANAFAAIQLLREAAKDKSTAENVIWNFSFGRPWQGLLCEQPKGITGIVATDSMAYSGDQPTFQNGNLNFNVAGMHFSSTGEVKRGNYSLVMNSSFARCLYGFNSAPVSATISVTQESGLQENAITTLSEFGGFLHLSATNFTFSEKNINVKLTQNPSKLVCVKKDKKRVVKKLTVLAYKCPTGYSKL